MGSWKLGLEIKEQPPLPLQETVDKTHKVRAPWGVFQHCWKTRVKMIK